MKPVLRIRICPECGKEVEYRSMNPFYQARKHNTLCKSCSKMGERNSFYHKKHSDDTIKILSDKLSGKNNPMYGKSAMLGKKQSDHQKNRQSEYMKQKWAIRKGVSVDELHNDWSEFKKYRREVDRLTSRQPIKMLENYEKRGKAGVDGAYHLDHIYSVYMGFKNGISANVIANINNLQMIPWLENQKKWYK